MKLIGIYGKMRSGKSIVCEALPIVLKDKYGVNSKISYSNMSTKMKQFVADQHNLKMSDKLLWVTNYNWFDSPFDFSDSDKSKEVEAGVTLGLRLQQFGSLLREENVNHLIENTMESIPPSVDYAVIDGVRHISDAEYIKSKGGIVIKVIGDLQKDSNGRDINHESEIALDEYKFNHIVNNNLAPMRGKAVLNMYNILTSIL